MIKSCVLGFNKSYMGSLAISKSGKIRIPAFLTALDSLPVPEKSSRKLTSSEVYRSLLAGFEGCDTVCSCSKECMLMCASKESPVSFLLGPNHVFSKSPRRFVCWIGFTADISQSPIHPPCNNISRRSTTDTIERPTTATTPLHC